jgi:hypothetical protein
VTYKDDPVPKKVPGVGLLARSEAEQKWHVVVGWIDMMPLVNWRGMEKVPIPGEVVEVIYDEGLWDVAVQ